MIKYFFVSLFFIYSCLGQPVSYKTVNKAMNRSMKNIKMTLAALDEGDINSAISIASAAAYKESRMGVELCSLINCYLSPLTNFSLKQTLMLCYSMQAYDYMCRNPLITMSMEEGYRVLFSDSTCRELWCKLNHELLYNYENWQESLKEEQYSKYCRGQYR